MCPSRCIVSPLKKTTSHPQQIKSFFYIPKFCLEYNTMSLDQYNSLMSDMLNEWHALTKLRAELEGREGRLCRCCGRFRHLAQKYRSGEEQKKKIVMGNKFEVLGSHVMQCGVRKARRQKIVREEVKCFGCREKGHKKWECPNMRKRHHCGRHGRR